MLDESQDYDAELSGALRYFLRQRGWTSQKLCDRTRLEPGSPRTLQEQKAELGNLRKQ